MREGGEAALCVLASCEAPEREGDGLTSMGAGVVLSSTAVRLGEHGTVHELAEGELFRWAYASEFDALRFTHPIALSAERCMVHLRLTNARVGMEQLVFYNRARRRPGARGQAVAHLCRKGGSVAGVRHGRGRAGSKVAGAGDRHAVLSPFSLQKRKIGNKKAKVPPKFRKDSGACGRTRTGDLRITNALLYQLSHTSMLYSEKWPSRSQLFQYSMVLKIRQDFFENFS